MRTPTPYIALGDINEAEATVRRRAVLIQDARGWPGYSNAYLHSDWEADVERARGRLYAARGKYREAEAVLHRAEVLKTASLRNLRTYSGGILPPAAQIQWVIHGLIARQGEMKSRQGRFAEGEADVRRAEVMAPPSHAATTSRPSTSVKANKSVLQSVVIGALPNR